MKHGEWRRAIIRAMKLKRIGELIVAGILFAPELLFQYACDLAALVLRGACAPFVALDREIDRYWWKRAFGKAAK